jgi:hypothetical protein
VSDIRVWPEQGDYEVIVEYGEKKLDPIKVWIEPRYESRWWWFGSRPVYYVCTEFGSQGPFYSEMDARYTANLAAR